MKSFAVVFCAAAFCCTAFAGAKINIELDGRSSKNVCSEINIISGDFNVVSHTEKDGSKYNYSIRGTKDLTSEWQTFSFSFVPSFRYLALGFCATHPKNEAVEYDDLKIEGGRIYNPSFEIINADNEADGWRYYAPDCIRSGNDAAEGKYYICTAYGAAVRQTMQMTPGQKVTVSFKARIGKTLQIPGERWFSSGKRKVK